MIGLLNLLALIFAIAATACAQNKDVSGWQNAVWGMQEKDIVATFGPRLRKLKKQAKFVTTYADYTIPDYEIDGRSYTVFFEMNNRTNSLSEILVRLNEMKSKQPREDIFGQLETMLTKTLGAPTNTNELRPSTPDKSYVRVILSRTWRFPTTTVELAYDWSNYIHTSLLAIKYVATN